jgi:hypothetical protein
MAKSSWGSRGRIVSSSKVHIGVHPARILKHYLAEPFDIYFDHPPVRELKDMTGLEKRAPEEQYGCKVVGR